jgi:hypothetical protein
MRRTLATSLVALVTVVGLALTTTPAVVAATDGGGPRANAPEASLGAAGSTGRERATAALQRAEQLFAGNPAVGRRSQARTFDAGGDRRADADVDASIVMRDLFSALDDLTPAQRRVARGILARPTDGPSDPYNDGYTVPAEKKCKGNFCVHWVTSTEDRPPSQTWVNQMLHLMNKVWKKEVNKLGYHPPVSDRGRGGNSKFDVYLAQIGDAGLYGYCAPERRKPGFQWLTSGYCVLDNDFVEFSQSPMDSAKVTAAHEFFHAIQFG